MQLTSIFSSSHSTRHTHPTNKKTNSVALSPRANYTKNNYGAIINIKLIRKVCIDEIVFNFSVQYVLMKRFLIFINSLNSLCNN
jgi:hypothetical protein